MRNSRPSLYPMHWVVLTVWAMLAGWLLWQSVLPWRAELAFREGEWQLHLSKGYQKHRKISTAIAKVKKSVQAYQDAVKLAPWEAYYHEQLAKAFDQFANVVSNADQKRHYLLLAMQAVEHSRTLDDRSPWLPGHLASLSLKQAAVAASESDRNILTKRAEEYTLLATELGPKNPLIALRAAHFYHQHSHIDHAKRFYQKALALDPLFEEANFHLGDIYQRANQPHKAIARFEVLYQHQPYFQRVDRRLARLYLQTERIEDAITIAQRSVEAFPSDPIPMELLASAYYQAGNYDQSRHWLHELLLRDPKNKQVRLAYVQTLRKLGRHDQASEQLNAYLDEFPDDPAGIALLQQVPR